MAVSLVEVATLYYGTGPGSITFSGAPAENNLILLGYGHDDASDNDSACLPTDFAYVTGSPWTACGDHGCGLAWKIAGASEGTTYALTDTHAGEQQGLAGVVFTGVDTSDPIGAVTYTCDTATADIEHSVTVPDDGSAVFCFSTTGTYSHTRGFQDDAAFPDIPGTLGNEYYSGYDNTYHSIVGALGSFNSGPTGTLIFGCNTGASENVSTVTIAINPAAGEAPTKIMPIFFKYNTDQR